MIRMKMLMRANRGVRGLGSAFESGSTTRFMITQIKSPYTIAFVRTALHGNNRGKTAK